MRMLCNISSEVQYERIQQELSSSIQQSGNINREVIQSLLLPQYTMDQFEKILTPSLDQNFWTNPPAYAFAQMIGLTHYEWLSYEYFSRDEEKDSGVMIVE